MRFEVAIKNRHLNYNKRKYKIDKDIKTYLNQILFRTYVKKHLRTILYKGNYYIIYNARKVIEQSRVSEKDKKKF